MTRQKIFKNKNDVFFYLCLVLIPSIQFAIFYIGVNFNSILLAFKDRESGVADKFAGLTNFIQIFSQHKSNSRYTIENLLLYAKNSLILYGFNTLVGITLALMFSYYISKKFKGAGLFKVFLYIPNIVSPAVLVIIYKYFLEEGYPGIVYSITGESILGLLTTNRFFWVIFYSIIMSFGTSVLMYTGAMGQISDSIFESASLEGVGPLREFVSIVVPLVFPTLSTFIVVGLAGLFTHQMNVFSFYGESDGVSDIWTIGMFLYREMKTNDAWKYYPYLSALGIVLTIITSSLTFILRGVLNKFDPTGDR